MNEFIACAVSTLSVLIHIDISPLSELITPHRKVVFVALGKSLDAVRLAVNIANSFGLKWYCVHATDVFHGAAGIIGPKDIIILVSHSGNTEEVVKCAQYFKNNTRIAITNNPESRLAKACNTHVYLPVDAEHSPFGYAPMTSSIAQVLLFNQLVADIVTKNNMQFECYANNHAGGSIGART